MITRRGYTIYSESLIIYGHTVVYDARDGNSLDCSYKRLGRNSQQLLELQVVLSTAARRLPLVKSRGIPSQVKSSQVNSSQVVGLRDRVAIVRTLIFSSPPPYPGGL